MVVDSIISDDVEVSGVSEYEGVCVPGADVEVKLSVFVVFLSDACFQELRILYLSFEVL